MFVQVIRGRASDTDRSRAELDRWERELAPGAHGWLGTTAGVTDDGDFVAVVRFSSEEDARTNSKRPAQGSWWEAFAAGLDGEVVFHDCTDVRLLGGGGSDDAGFVQVIEGRSDPDRVRELADLTAQVDVSFRPEIIGGTLAVHADDPGGFTQVVYFTSEEDARAAEQREDVPPDMAELRERFADLTGERRFLDLRDPWLFGPS